MIPRKDNRRRHFRTRAQNLVAHLRVDGHFVQAPVEDISMGGLLARTSEVLPVGTSVSFDLARPGLKRPLRVGGVVVDLRPGRGIGIRFDGLEGEAVERLRELINSVGGLTASVVPDKPARGAGSVPHGAASAPVNPSDSEERLQAQLRAMVIELGRLQELVQQREKELHAARAEIARMTESASSGGAPQKLFAKLEAEKMRLDAELAELRARSRHEAETIQREVTAAASALARSIESVRRLP